MAGYKKAPASNQGYFLEITSVLSLLIIFALKSAIALSSVSLTMVSLIPALLKD